MVVACWISDCRSLLCSAGIQMSHVEFGPGSLPFEHSIPVCLLVFGLLFYCISLGVSPVLRDKPTANKQALSAVVDRRGGQRAAGQHSEVARFIPA